MRTRTFIKVLLVALVLLALGVILSRCLANDPTAVVSTSTSGTTTSTMAAMPTPTTRATTTTRARHRARHRATTTTKNNKPFTG